MVEISNSYLETPILRILEISHPYVGAAQPTKGSWCFVFAIFSKKRPSVGKLNVDYFQDPMR